MHKIRSIYASLTSEIKQGFDSGAAMDAYEARDWAGVRGKQGTFYTDL